MRFKAIYITIPDIHYLLVSLNFMSYRQNSERGIPIVHAHQEFRGDTFNDYTPGNFKLWFKPIEYQFYQSQGFLELSSLIG